jgi:hypothetical protein
MVEHGVTEREAPLAWILVALGRPTGPMEAEPPEASLFEAPFGRLPRRRGRMPDSARRGSGAKRPKGTRASR